MNLLESSIFSSNEDKFSQLFLLESLQIDLPVPVMTVFSVRNQVKGKLNSNLLSSQILIQIF